MWENVKDIKAKGTTPMATYMKYSKFSNTIPTTKTPRPEKDHLGSLSKTLDSVHFGASEFRDLRELREGAQADQANVVKKCCDVPHETLLSSRWKDAAGSM